MFTEKFFDVLKHEGVVAIGTSLDNQVHISNTWNSYLIVTEDNKILIPAAGMVKTEKNLKDNNQLKLTLASHEVMGYRSMGTGFLIEGTGRFLKDGENFDLMKAKCPFLSRTLEITVTSCKQTL